MTPAGQQQAEAQAIGAGIDAAGAWKPLMALVAVVLPITLAFLLQRRDTPTVVKEIGHDPAEDAYDRDLAAAAAAGRVAGVDR